MSTRMAILHAKPEDVIHVKQALSEMVRAAAVHDPTLDKYAVYESVDTPGVFLIEQHLTAVEERLDSNAGVRLMEVGTALREQLSGPIQIAEYRLVEAGGR